MGTRSRLVARLNDIQFPPKLFIHLCVIRWILVTQIWHVQTFECQQTDWHLNAIYFDQFSVSVRFCSIHTGFPSVFVRNTQHSSLLAISLVIPLVLCSVVHWFDFMLTLPYRLMQCHIIVSVHFIGKHRRKGAYNIKRRNTRLRLVVLWLYHTPEWVCN